MNPFFCGESSVPDWRRLFTFRHLAWARFRCCPLRRSSLTISPKPDRVGAVRLNRGLLQANVLFRLAPICLFPFLFLQVLLGLPPHDYELSVFSVAPPGARTRSPP